MGDIPRVYFKKMEMVKSLLCCWLLVLPSALRAKTSGLTAVPRLVFKTSWDSQVTPYPESYGSMALKISPDGYVHVLNGANDGNEIVTFTLNGTYIGKIPGWYNFPVDMVLHQNNQTLVSAIGAMGDDHSMRFGMILYNSSGQFFHGFHESETGLVRPYGLGAINSTGSKTNVTVCDWNKNETRFIEVDWEEGRLTVQPDNIIKVPYPTSVGVSADKLLIVSDVCCESWHEPLRKISLFTGTGNFVREMKDLPTGERISTPEKVAVDPRGNFLVRDQGLNKTLLFTSDLEYIGYFEDLGTPTHMEFYQNQLFTIEENNSGYQEMHKVRV